MDTLVSVNTDTNLARVLNISDIVSEYGKRLLGFIRKRVKNTNDAEDILQDVYYQLTETDRLMKPIDNVAAWLFTVARNRITDMYRKKRPSLLPEISNEEDNAVIELGNFMFQDDDTPETEYLRSIIWEEFDKALSELPPEQRYVFEKNEIEGIAFKDLAEETGEPVNTLISRKRYAVLYLRERLQNLYDELLNI